MAEVSCKSDLSSCDDVTIVPLPKNIADPSAHSIKTDVKIYNFDFDNNYSFSKKPSNEIKIEKCSHFYIEAIIIPIHTNQRFTHAIVLKLQNTKITLPMEIIYNTSKIVTSGDNRYLTIDQSILGKNNTFQIDYVLFSGEGEPSIIIEQNENFFKNMNINISLIIGHVSFNENFISRELNVTNFCVEDRTMKSLIHKFDHDNNHFSGVYFSSRIKPDKCLISTSNESKMIEGDLLEYYRFKKTDLYYPSRYFYFIPFGIKNDIRTSHKNNCVCNYVELYYNFNSDTVYFYPQYDSIVTSKFIKQSNEK